MKKMQLTLPKNKNNLLSYLSLLTLFFIFLEISVFVQGSEMYLGDYKLVADRLNIPANVLPEIIFFLGAQLFLHAVWLLVIWRLAISVGKVLKLSSAEIEKNGLVLWFASIILILVANQHFFPNSKFAHLSRVIFSSKIEVYLLIILSAIFLTLFFIVFYGIVISRPKWVLLVFFALTGTVIGYRYWPKPMITDASTLERPNIILIGIDSLRPDFLGYFGYEKTTPHLDAFLNQASVFTDAFTPLARTFPAWVSILSGQYPKRSGVRFNLPTIAVRHWDNTLPVLLRNQGYETIFSTDETRFSNIDQTYGFDKTLTPPIGFNDFLLGNLNDFPLANLVVNTPLGKWLFPHSYGNRPVFTTYNPNTFLDFIRPSLMQSRTKPLFLAIHFCLPHFPYFWGMNNADDKSIHNYQASIKRIDQQFEDFLQILYESRLLDHAIIIVLSDHGEAIELPGDRVTNPELFISHQGAKKTIPHFFPPSFDTETVNQSAGHGTDVLGLSQYHIVLACRTFGLAFKNQIQNMTSRVSLLDIKPTLLDFIGVKENRESNDGRSLKETIVFAESSAAPKVSKAPEHFFYESDFSPQAVRTVHPETRQLLFEGIDYFQVDAATGRISVKKSMEKLIISSKQFADLYGEWVLALYPQNKTQMMPVLVNLKTGQWTNDLTTAFAKQSPARSMLKALKGFFKEDISQIVTTS